MQVKLFKQYLISIIEMFSYVEHWVIDATARDLM